jgi:uncharacterized protein
MKTSFIDTNLFIRYLTNDDPHKADKVETLLDAASAGNIKLVTAEVVIAEVVWVLESAYGLKSTAIAPMIRAILATPGLQVTNKAVIAKALPMYAGLNIDFIDAYIAALMESMRISDIYSFDKRHIERVKKIKRLEP